MLLSVSVRLPRGFRIQCFRSRFQGIGFEGLQLKPNSQGVLVSKLGLEPKAP